MNGVNLSWKIAWPRNFR